jgi:hypothetical protein
VTTLIAEVKALQDGFRSADQVPPPVGRPPQVTAGTRILAHRQEHVLEQRELGEQAADLESANQAALHATRKRLRGYVVADQIDAT